MKKSLLLVGCVLLGAFGFSRAGRAQTPLQEFVYDGGVFFQLPIGKPEWQTINGIFTWVQVDDKAHRCYTLHNEWAQDPENDAKRVFDPKRDLHFFLSLTGQYFDMTSDDTTWTPVGFGTPAATIDWTHSQQSGSQTVEQYLVWLGSTHNFVQDPRDTDATKGSPGVSANWYQVGPGGVCHVFTEANRNNGSFGLQTINLASDLPGVPVWRLETGRATLGNIVEVGNWYSGSAK